RRGRVLALGRAQHDLLEAPVEVPTPDIGLGRVLVERGEPEPAAVRREVRLVVVARTPDRLAGRPERGQAARPGRELGHPDVGIEGLRRLRRRGRVTRFRALGLAGSAGREERDEDDGEEGSGQERGGGHGGTHPWSRVLRTGAASAGVTGCGRVSRTRSRARRATRPRAAAGPRSRTRALPPALGRPRPFLYWLVGSAAARPPAHPRRVDSPPAIDRSHGATIGA